MLAETLLRCQSKVGFQACGHAASVEVDRPLRAVPAARSNAAGAKGCTRRLVGFWLLP